MAVIQTVRCPNCGSLAERLHLPLLAQVKTQCHKCDYLMVMCSRSGKVVEAHAPGLYSEYLYAKITDSSNVNSNNSNVTPLVADRHLEKVSKVFSNVAS